MNECKPLMIGCDFDAIMERFTDFAMAPGAAPMP